MTAVVEAHDRAAARLLELQVMYAVDPHWRASPPDEAREKTPSPGAKKKRKRRKCGPYRPASLPDGRAASWTPERRAKHAAKMREVLARPEVREALRQRALRMWREGRRRTHFGPDDIIPAWVEQAGLESEFFDAFREGGEMAAAAHCRRLLRMMERDEL